MTGINANLLTSLEKQLSWAVKACFIRKQLDSSKDLKFQHSIMPIKWLLEYRCSVYTKQFMAKCKPAFTSNSLKLSISDFYRHIELDNIFAQKTSTRVLDKSSIRQGILMQNQVPNTYDVKSVFVLKKRYINMFWKLSRRTQANYCTVTLIGNRTN